jgi:hypothetical protein
MGCGYWILVWDGFGIGLNLINPRMHEENGNNWFDCDGCPSNQEIVEKHNLKQYYDFKIIKNWE